jgi:hypothetical protein
MSRRLQANPGKAVRYWGMGDLIGWPVRHRRARASTRAFASYGAHPDSAWTAMTGVTAIGRVRLRSPCRQVPTRY